MEEMLKKPARVTIEGEETGEKIDADKTGEKIADEDAETVEGERTSEKIEGEKTGMETPQLADQVGEQRTSSPGRVNRATGIVDRPLNQAAGPGEKMEGEKTGKPSWKRQRTRLSLLKRSELSRCISSPQPKASPPAGPSQERQAAADVDALTAREVSKGLTLVHDADNAAREHLPELAYDRYVQALHHLLGLDKSHPRVVALKKTIAEYVEVAEGLADVAGRASAATASVRNVAMVGWLEESANEKLNNFMNGY